MKEYANSRAANIKPLSPEAVPTVSDAEIDFARYMTPPEEFAKVIQPASLTERVTDLVTGKRATGGLLLPWPQFADKVRLRPGKVSVWTGRTHSGKTALLKMLMTHAVRSGEKVCMASMEEMPEETMLDMVSMTARTMRPDEFDVEKFATWAEGKLWYYDQQSMVEFWRMIAVMNYAAEEKGCTHFVIDSLMRLALPRDDYDAQRQMFNLLGNHAKARGVHVHIVCHGRKQDREDRPLDVADIRGAGDIGDQADNVFSVWRNMSDRKAPGDPDGVLVVKKQRGRPNWLGKILLWFDEPSGQFLAGRMEPQFRFISDGESWRDYT